MIILRNKSLGRGTLRARRKVSLKVDEESEVNCLFSVPSRENLRQLKNRSMYAQLKDVERQVQSEKSVRVNAIRGNSWRIMPRPQLPEQEGKIDIGNLKSFIQINEPDRDSLVTLQSQPKQGHETDQIPSMENQLNPEISGQDKPPERSMQININNKDTLSRSPKEIRTSKEKTSSSGDDFEFSCVDLDETKENNFYNESLRNIDPQTEAKWDLEINFAGCKYDSESFAEVQNFSKNRANKNVNDSKDQEAHGSIPRVDFSKFNLKEDTIESQNVKKVETNEPQIELELQIKSLQNSNNSFKIRKMTMEKVNGELVEIEQRAGAINEFKFPRKLSGIPVVTDSRRPSLWRNNEAYLEMSKQRLNGSDRKPESQELIEPIQEHSGSQEIPTAQTVKRETSGDHQNEISQQNQDETLDIQLRELLSSRELNTLETPEINILELSVSRDFDVVVEENEYSDGKHDSIDENTTGKQGNIKDLMKMLQKKTDELPSVKLSHLSDGQSHELKESWPSRFLDEAPGQEYKRVISDGWALNPNPFTEQIANPDHAQLEPFISNKFIDIRVQNQKIPPLHGFKRISHKGISEDINSQYTASLKPKFGTDDHGFQEIGEVTEQGIGVGFKRRAKKRSVNPRINHQSLTAENQFTLPDSFCKTLDNSHFLPNAFSKFSKAQGGQELQTPKEHTRRPSGESKKTKRPDFSDVEKPSHHYMTSESNIESTIDLKGSADFNLESFQEKYGQQSGYDWPQVVAGGVQGPVPNTIHKQQLPVKAFRSSQRNRRQEPRRISISGVEMINRSLNKRRASRKQSEGTQNVSIGLDTEDIMDRRASNNSNKQRLKGRVVNQPVIETDNNQMVRVVKKAKHKLSNPWEIESAKHQNLSKNETIALAHTSQHQKTTSNSVPQQKLVMGSMLSDEEGLLREISVDLGSHVSLNIESQQFIEPSDQLYSQTGFESVIGDFGEATVGSWINEELILPASPVEHTPARDFQKKDSLRLGLTEEAKEKAAQGMKKYKTSKLAKKIVRMSKKASQKETINIRSLIGSPLTQSISNNLEQLSHNPTKSSLRSKLKRSVVGSTKKSLRDRLRGSGVLKQGSSMGSDSKLGGTLGSLSVHSISKSTKPLKMRNLKGKINRVNVLDLSKSNSRDIPIDALGRRVSDSRPTKFGGSAQFKGTEGSERCESLFDKEMPKEPRQKTELKRSQTMAYNSKAQDNTHSQAVVQKSESLKKTFFPNSGNSPSEILKAHKELVPQINPQNIFEDRVKIETGAFVILRTKTSPERPVFHKKRSLSEEHVMVQDKNRMGPVNSAFRANHKTQKPNIPELHKPSRRSRPKKMSILKSRPESFSSKNRFVKDKSSIHGSKPRPVSVDSGTSSNLMRRLATASDSSFFPFPKSVSSKFGRGSRRLSKDGSTGGRRVEGRDKIQSVSGTDTIGFESGTDRDVFSQIIGGKRHARAQKEEYGIGSISNL